MCNGENVLSRNQACIYIPTVCAARAEIQRVFFIVCSRLSEPQWPLKNRRHGHFEGVLVLVIYHLVALVELLAAILRVRTQVQVCIRSKKAILVRVRTKKFELCQTRVEEKKKKLITHTWYMFILFICGFVLPISYRNKNNHRLHNCLIFVNSLQSWASTIQSVVLTSDVFQFFTLYKIFVHGLQQTLLI